MKKNSNDIHWNNLVNFFKLSNYKNDYCNTFFLSLGLDVKKMLICKNSRFELGLNIGI